MNDLAKNVLGGVLQPCSTDPMTGFFRTGDCRVTEEDLGNHGVCIVATAEFLAFSRSRGNDLSTPHPQFGFPGLRPHLVVLHQVDHHRRVDAAGAAGHCLLYTRCV